MLIVGRDRLVDDWVRNFADALLPGTLLVLNDTRVRRARLVGQRTDTGGQVELLLLGRDVKSAPGRCELWTALGRPLRRLHSGVRLTADGLCVRVVERQASSLVVELVTTDSDDVEAALERVGHVPIPPYLGRSDEPDDATRYQTVFAKRRGSVAAPTAGLHLTSTALDTLVERGVEIGYATLHVGIGTFRPVAVDDLDNHPMHAEWFEVDEELAAKIRTTRLRGGRVVAVGTTAVRALESAADPEQAGCVEPMSRETRLLIQPGFRFRVVDGLLTNFHQPKSTLLALVAAAAGVEVMHNAYRAALARGYRFLSYGDAMWIPEIAR